MLFVVENCIRCYSNNFVSLCENGYTLVPVGCLASKFNCDDDYCLGGRVGLEFIEHSALSRFCFYCSIKKLFLFLTCIFIFLVL